MREIEMSTTNLESTEMKEAFYQAGDGISNLNWVAKRHPELYKDKKLSDIINDLDEVHEMLQKYLDKNYEWD